MANSEASITGLKINLPAHEPLLINGALLYSNDRTKLIVSTPDSRVLRGDMVMTAEKATTPMRKIYLLMQNAYMTRSSIPLREIHAEIDAAPEFQRPALRDVWAHVSERGTAELYSYITFKYMYAHFEYE